ncbi:MAG: DUF3160 domain-containing protein [Treponema sp.]|nr:DUF3160 domain-containing protein [Treponema sp.]
MKKIYSYLTLSFFCFYLLSCNKGRNVQTVKKGPAVQVNNTASTPVDQDPSIAKKISFKLTDDTNDQKISQTAFHTDAHSKFLNDPMTFVEIPTQNITEGKSAVVASYVCKIYPAEAFTFKDDVAVINKNIDSLGIDVPFGTIVPIRKKLSDAEPEYSYAQGMFHFQDNWNWFYESEWNGTKGWIFGADLYGLNDTLENNRISAMLYQTAGKYESFYPISGYIPLEENVKDSLANNRLAMQNLKVPRYISVDDMIDQYNTLRYIKSVPLFITTDLAAHSQHLIFDRMLQYTEEYEFLPRMQKLTDMFIETLSRRTEVPKQIREQAVQYFQVPQAIFMTAPERSGNGSYRQPIVYNEKNETEIQSILSNYPKEVQENYKKIMAAQPDKESIFNEDEDFSQCKPRGHYTKNGLLETYFRAQMWYGHLHFTITKPQNNKATPDSILQKEAVITFIVDTVQNNKELYSQWSKLFTPITSLIGLSDDLSFDDICPLWKDQNITDFSKWASNADNITSFMSLCADTLRPPAISGQSVFKQYAEIDEKSGMPKTPMGWRLFGQRFTYDSLVHEKVSPPRLMSRDIVSGLDIMKSFGSKTAEALLQQSDYQTMKGLKNVLDSFENSFAACDSSFWNQTYYNQVLYQIKTLATFEQGAGFYFTESPAWNLKSQITAHATWAELRHDTILYVKQVFAERAGDGDFEPTFRTEPLPKPVHYIEPNLPFWESSLSSVIMLTKIYEDYDLLDNETKFTLESLVNLYTRIIEIVKNEVADLPISSKDNDWIPTISASLRNLVLIHNNNGYIDDEDLLKMACIADVYTNNELNVCLEVGVGTPVRLYVPLNDSQGGKRIAIGYSFKYVEFLQPSNDRMSDESWKQIVYKDDPKDFDKYLPFWEKKCFLSPTTLSNFRQ